MEDFLNSLDAFFEKGKVLLDQSRPELTFKERGVVSSLAKGMAKVKGLPSVAYEELLLFPRGVFGIAFSIEENEIGVVLLDDGFHLKICDEVLRTGRLLDVPVGEEFIGRVIDPLGNPLDDRPCPSFSCRFPLERPAPAIKDRLPVTVPLQTGLKVIDALIPIGRGQKFPKPEDHSHSVLTSTQ